MLGQDFSLPPVEPTLAFLCVGSTGEWFLSPVRVFGVSCGCTGALDFTSIGSTGVTSVFAFLPVQPKSRVFLTSV